MKKPTAWIVAAGVAIVGSAAFFVGSGQLAPQSQVAHAAAAKSAPDFSLPTVPGGSTVKLSDYKGKVVLVNFWATWCPPCREEIPDFIKVRDSLNAKGFEIIGIAMDEGGAKVVAPFAKEYGITYPLVLGNQQVTRSYGGIRGIPTSFLVDRDGKIVQKWVGMISEETLTEAVTAVL